MVSLNRLRRRIGMVRNLPREAYFTLSGWRFDDLKQHIANVVSQDHDAAMSVSVLHDASMSMSVLNNALTRSGQDSAPRIALVTCLPPDETGIANFSFEHLAVFPEPIAVFTPVRDVSRYFHNMAVLAQKTSSNVSVHPISSLLALNALWDFEKIIVVVGNSHHNLEACKQIRHLASVGMARKIVCYLHDPCCLNIVQCSRSLSNDQMVSLMAKVYPEKAEVKSYAASWQLHAALVEQDIMGIRALYDSGAHSFIVNSQFAAELVQGDLTAEQRANVTINTLFHPVFAQNLVSEYGDEKSTLRTIGTFGFASEAKGTDVLIDAVARLNAQGEETRLIVSGYGASRFITAIFGSKIPSWLHHNEPETERELQLDMQKCDLAVQLRRHSLGESSGVVPTLIGMAIPTVVSPVGAFQEYGDAVSYFQGYDSGALAEFLIKMPSVSPTSMKIYAQEHSVAVFNRMLIDSLAASADTSQEKVLSQ